MHKTIPAGAGLGGGSADAAFTLQLLNKRFNLSLSTAALEDYALQLGSDCPFFMINTPCFATDRGEILLPVEINLSGYEIVIVIPGIPVHTGKAFAGITPALPHSSVRNIVQQPVETWKEELVNDFEITVFEQYPPIKAIKEELYSKGAIYASMSGSGSAVYGIFEKQKHVQFSFPSGYIVKHLTG